MFDRISVLFIKSKGDGSLVGWFYHPNREALREREEAFAQDFDLEVVEYTRAAREGEAS